MFEIREDDLSGEATRRLLALHLKGMHANSPTGSVYALGLSALKAPGVTVWSVWHGGEIVGIGALKELGDGGGELKSMRTHPDHLRRGVAASLLEHIVANAKARGLTRLSLETGSGPPSSRHSRSTGSAASWTGRPSPTIGEATSTGSSTATDYGRVRMPLAIRRRPGRKMIVTPVTGGSKTARPTRTDPVLVKALAWAFRYQHLTNEGR